MAQSTGPPRYGVHTVTVHVLLDGERLLLRCVPRAIWQGFYRFTFGDVKELIGAEGWQVRMEARHVSARQSANMRMMRCLASLSRVESEHHVGRMEHTMGRVLFRIADQPLQKNVEP